MVNVGSESFLRTVDDGLKLIHFVRCATLDRSCPWRKLELTETISDKSQQKHAVLPFYSYDSWLLSKQQNLALFMTQSNKCLNISITSPWVSGAFFHQMSVSVCVSFCVSASVLRTWCTAQRDGCQLPRFPPAVGPLTKKPSEVTSKIRNRRKRTGTESETRIDKVQRRTTKEDNTAGQAEAICSQDAGEKRSVPSEGAYKSSDQIEATLHILHPHNIGSTT